MEFAGDDALAARVAEGMYARDVAAQKLGISIEAVRVGYARVAMTVRDDMLMGHGLAHGGFIFALADTAFAYACNGRNEPNVALQCSISFLSPGRLGERLIAECGQRGHARRTGLYDAEVRHDDRVIALFRGVPYRLDGTVIPQ